MKISKLKAIVIFIPSFLVWLVKKFWTLIFYPLPYLAYDWVMDCVTRKAYTRPEKIFANPIKWFFWLHYDDDQPPEGSREFVKENYPNGLQSKWDRFVCSYKWTAIRNAMYNVNYNYLSNTSPIILHEKIFGYYAWDRKLRCSNGDNGFQLVFYKTAKNQNRFLFSMAKRPFGMPLTIYIGWNTNFNGRFTFAGKFK